MNYEISHPEMFSHAMDFFGEREVVGPEHNPVIVNFFHEIGFDWVNSDETAWCSAILNYLAMKTGYERSGALDARSWLRVGKSITTPTVGDVVVLWRNDPNGWEGHVGMFIRIKGNYVYVLGGNQANEFNISKYPVNRILGYRMLKKIKS